MRSRHAGVHRSWISFVVVATAVLTLTLHTGRSLGSSPPQPPCSDDSYEPDDECAGYFYRLFQVGSSERHQLCDRDWTSFTVVDGTRYRIETSGLVGGADTVIELWGLDSSSCGSRIAYDDNGGGGLASRIDWTARVGYSDWEEIAHVLVAQVGEEYRDGMGYQLTVQRIHRSYVVPVVAHAPGAGGELWVSDLWLFNPTDEALDLDLVLTPTGPTGPQHRMTRVVPIGPRETLTLSDPVFALFQSTGSGWLEIGTPGVDLVAASRICSNGTCQGIPVHAREEALIPSWPGAFLLPVTGTARGRTNLGLVELFDGPAEVIVQMWDEQGQQLAHRNLDLAAGAHLQVNDLFNFLGVPRRDGVLIGVSSASSGGITTYASVVDGESSDASFAVHTTYMGYGVYSAVVPLACGGSSGLQTDLVVSNYPYPRTLTLELLPPAGSGQQPLLFDYGIGPDQTVVFEDVVTALGGEGCAALVVSGSHVIIASRTFRTGTEGTLGDVVPAVLDTDLAGRGDGPLTAPSSGDSARETTALSWANHTSAPGVAVVRLVAATGEDLGELEVPVEAYRWSQLDDVFAALGVTPQPGGRVELEVVEGAARVAACATTSNPASGDFVVLPMQPIPRPQIRDVYLTARDVILVDQLPEAVGLDTLPSGIFTATVSGVGDLGADSLPIHVACLYHGPDGRLRSAALGLGESVSDIGGDQPFWCFIPDWIRSDDNWGAVEVTLEGPQTVTFQLDPITNCVLLDRDESSVIEAAPAQDFRVEATGHFGSSLMVPQLLVMAKEAVGHRLEVMAVVNGDEIGPLWSGNQLLAVGLDHGSRTDNQGSMWLRAQGVGKLAAGRAPGATTTPER